MNILRAELAQLPQLVVLFDLYRQFYHQPTNPEKAAEFLRDRINREESVIFMAEEPSAPQRAMGFVQLYPSFSSVSMRRLWVLNDLFVHADFRKQGVAHKLLERARNWAVETDAVALMLETGKDNLAAQSLYEKTGWERSTDYYVYYQTP